MPKRKLPRPFPLPVDLVPRSRAHPADLLEIVDGRVQHCWPWPFRGQTHIEEAAALADVTVDHPLIHEVVLLLRRHVHKRYLVEERDLPATANPRKEIAEIQKAITALLDAFQRLSGEAYTIASDGGADTNLATTVRAAAAVEQHLKALGYSGTVPGSRGGAPRKARSILIGRIEAAFDQHRGERAKGRRQFTEFCLRAIGEATEGGPTEYDAIEKAGQRERRRKRAVNPPAPSRRRATKPA